MQISSSLSMSPHDPYSRSRGPLLTVFAVLLTTAMVIVAAVIALKLANQGRIYPGVRVDGVDVSHVRTTDAVDRLAGQQRLLDATRVTAAVNGRQWVVQGRDVGLHYDSQAQVQAAYSLGRAGALLDRLRTQATLLIKPRNLAPVISYDSGRLSALVQDMARRIDRPAVNARVVVRDGAPVVVRQSADGMQFDQSAAARLLIGSLLRKQTSPVALPVTVLTPRITTATTLDRALRAALSLATARRTRISLQAYSGLLSTAQERLLNHAAVRLIHLQTLVAARRSRASASYVALTARAAYLSVVTAAGRTYRVPPALAQRMLRVASPGLAPRVTVDAAGVQRYVALLAVQVDRAPQPAHLVLHNGHLTAVAATTGIALDEYAAVNTLTARLQQPRATSTDARLTVTYPRAGVQVAALLPALQRGRWLLAHPPTLVLGHTHWTPAAGALGAALRVVTPPSAAGLTALSIDPASLRRAAAWLADQVGRAPRDATFSVDGQHARVVPSVNGQALDTVALARILLQLPPGTRNITVPLRVVIPRLTTARARAMGITTMVGMSYTNFYGSTANKITNILTAVHALDGSLIAPGQVFSFNQSIGDIDYAHGYVDGISIIDGQDVPGVGGGVCQVAVTIFKGAIYSGFPIIERIPHDNVVSYYQPIGMDATIYDAPGGPDVKFKNNTGHWLLMKFNYDLPTAYLEVRFYSTSIDQKAVIEGPYVTYLANGDTSAIFYRQVFRHNKKIIDESFSSLYVPTQSAE